jgi:putative DNA methylase
MNPKKKLIEVALPLEAINKASAREKSIRHGHPSTLHLWWARRPLAAARAVIFAQMVDDPSAHPERFPTEEAQERERQRLFRLIEELVQWENTTNETVLAQAREEIWKSWRITCAAVRQEIENSGEEIGQRVRDLYDPDKLPAFHDPFAGGGALPLEAQRLGLESYASDLNPVAVLINKAMIEIPPKFAGRAPVNPESRKQWIGNSNALPRTDSLAEGNGGSEGSVSAGALAATGGDLRDAVADHAGGGVSSGEYSGRLDTRVGQRESAFSSDRPGFTGGDRDVPNPVRGNRLVSERGDGAASIPAERSRQNVDCLAAHFPRETLTPTSYFLFPRPWKGAAGLAEDVRYYGKWMRDEAEKRIGHLYPKIEITAEMTEDRPDLKPLVGHKLTVIAWLWARTVKSPNPAFAHVDVPLVSTFMLSTKAGKEAYVEPVIENSDQEIGNSRADPSISYPLSSNSSPGYRFTVKMGKPKDAEVTKHGTKSGGSGTSFLCLMSGTPMPFDYLRSEAKAGRMGARLMAIVAEGERGRVYLAPTSEHEAIALSASPNDPPETDLPVKALGFRVQEYGMAKWRDLFTPRQLVALTTFSDLVGEAREQIRRDAAAAGLPDDGKLLRDGGTGAQAYAEAVGVYLAFVVDYASNYWSVIATPADGFIRGTFARQALPMTWDYAEAPPFGNTSGNWFGGIEWVSKALEALPLMGAGVAAQADAAAQSISSNKLVSTDPPYYDNIGYADLSDFFYIWLRRSLRPVFPDLFATLTVPKAEELVATPYRHGSKEKAEAFFLGGMTQAMQLLAAQVRPAFPVTIYYAFKQSESEGNVGTASTGWETFLDAVISAGFAITGTWPMRTERGARSVGIGTNALASSIVLVCRPRPHDATTTTRRDFVKALKYELPDALKELQHDNIAPVDLAQSTIGPGMAIFTRYAKVLESDDSSMTVRTALQLINQALDEYLSEQEGEYDADTRFAITWFEAHGMEEGPYGDAETLATARGVAVSGVQQAGILQAKGGKVRLLKREEMPHNWDPATDTRLTVWEAAQHLIRTMETKGEAAAGELITKLGSMADIARDLVYRLYGICEKKKWADEALAYNSLVIAWPELTRLAVQVTTDNPSQEQLF